jgi:hypothetical protein
MPFGHDDDIMFVGKQALVESKKFSDESFDSVSLYRVSRFFCDGKSESFNPVGIAACYDRKMFGTSPHPLLINCSKPACVGYPFRFPVNLLLHAC